MNPELLRMLMGPAMGPLARRLSSGAPADAAAVRRSPPPAAPRGASIGPDTRGPISRFMQKNRLGEQPVAQLAQMLGINSPADAALAATPIAAVQRGGQAAKLLMMPGRTLKVKVQNALRGVESGLVRRADLYDEMRDLVDARRVTIAELSGAGRNAAERAEIARRLRETGKNRRAVERAMGVDR